MNTAGAWSFVRSTALLGGALLVTACPGSLTDEEKAAFNGIVGNGGGGGSAMCDAPAVVLQTGCGNRLCHDSTTKQSEIDLSVADPFPALLNKAPDPTGDCNESGKLVIDAANPEASMLYTKMFRSDDPQQSSMFTGCGLPMPYPFGPEKGKESERACVLAWIKQKLAAGGGAGAPGSGGGGGTSGADGSGGAAGGATGGASGGPGTGGASGASASDCVDGDTEVTKSGWTASASVSEAASPASGAIDADLGTRWGTGEAQAVGQWFQVAFGSAQAFDKIVFDSKGSSMYDDTPVGTYDLKVSTDGTTFNTVAAMGTKANGVLTVTPNMCVTGARAVRIELTQGVASGGTSWFSVYDVKLYK